MPTDLAGWIAIAVAALGGGFLRDVGKWVVDSWKGRNAARRDEVARAIAERDKAVLERDAARSELSWWQRWARIVEESLALHRRRMIDAPCLTDQDIPTYPSRPDKD